MVDTNLSTLLPIIGSLGVGWLVFLIAGALYVGFLDAKVFYSVSCDAMVNGFFAQFRSLGERTTRS